MDTGKGDAHHRLLAVGGHMFQVDDSAKASLSTRWAAPRQDHTGLPTAVPEALAPHTCYMTSRWSYTSKWVPWSFVSQRKYWNTVGAVFSKTLECCLTCSVDMMLVILAIYWISLAFRWSIAFLARLNKTMMEMPRYVSVFCLFCTAEDSCAQ